MILETQNYIHDQEFQIRTFGWILLVIWMAAVVYIARNFFFPKFYEIYKLEDQPNEKTNNGSLSFFIIF